MQASVARFIPRTGRCFRSLRILISVISFSRVPEYRCRTSGTDENAGNVFSDFFVIETVPLDASRASVREPHDLNGLAGRGGAGGISSMKVCSLAEPSAFPWRGR